MGGGKFPNAQRQPARLLCISHADSARLLPTNYALSTASNSRISSSGNGGMRDREVAATRRRILSPLLRDEQRGQLIEVHRLRKVVIESGFVREAAITLLCVAGDGDHQCVRESIRAQMPRER